MLNLLNVIPWYYKLLAVAVAFLGVFTYGYMKGNENSNIAIAKYEKQVADQGHRIVNGQIVVNDKIVTVYQDRIKKVYIRKEYNDGLIENVVPDSSNELALGWVRVHDAAATGSDVTAASAADAAPSGVTPNPALRVIAGNYGICQENAEQLEALQNWIKDSAKNVEAANKKK